VIDFDGPLRGAWRRTRAQIFEPFAVRKWLALGFTAFLASLAGGGASFGALFQAKVPDGSLSLKNLGTVEELLALGPVVWFAIISAVALVICGIVLVLMWIGARGQFIFLENVLANRVEIRRPWREFRTHGNGFFKFYLWIVSLPGIAVLLFICAGLLVFQSHLIKRRMPAFSELAPWVLGFVVILLAAIAWSVLMMFYRDFGVPMMAAGGCAAGEAFRRVWHLLATHPGDCLLYAVARVAMGIVFVLLTVVAGLVTCGIGFLPYVGTLLTLPLWVFRQSFVLDCLAQLAPEYRLWREDSQTPGGH